MSVEQLQGVRDRLMPMLRLATEQYRHRVPPGYPTVIDAVERGIVGLELDPGFALYVVSDGEQLFADFSYRAHRYDVCSSASREKFAGLPVDDRRPLAAAVSDQALRNLVAELMSRWNSQPGILYVSDS